MSSSELIGKVGKRLKDTLLPYDENVEKLRKIMEIEQKRNITFKEANDIGRQLISLYEFLAGNRKITPPSSRSNIGSMDKTNGRF